MNNEQFGAHIEELAEQIKVAAVDKLAEQYAADVDLQYAFGMSRDEYRSFVRDVYLTWIPSEFLRASMVPHQDASMVVGEELEKIAGAGDLTEGEPPAGGYLEGVDFNDIRLGGGILSEEAFSYIPTIQIDLAPWETAALERFKDDFLPGIAVALSNHITVARAMRNVAAANYRMMALAREDADGVAHDTVAVLESFGDCEAPWSGDAKATVSVAAAAASLLGGIITFPIAPPVGGVAVGAGFSVLGSALAGWVTLEDSRANAESPTLSADTVDGILGNMSDALRLIYVKLDEGNEALRAVLSDLCGQMEDNRRACLSPRPTTFADATEDDVIEIVEG